MKDQPTMYDLNKACESPQGNQPTGECTCGNLGPEQGIPSPLCPVHKHAWDKPTGEWTAQRIVQFLGLPSKHTEAASFLADAINAALAAAEEKYEDATDSLYRDIKRLNQQLAAVTEGRDNAAENCMTLSKLLYAARIDWSELRDLLGLPSTDFDQSLVISAIKDLHNQIDNQQDEITDLQHTVQYLLDIINNHREVHTI